MGKEICISFYLQYWNEDLAEIAQHYGRILKRVLREKMSIFIQRIIAIIIMIHLINDKHLVFHFQLVKISVDFFQVYFLISHSFIQLWVIKVGFQPYKVGLMKKRILFMVARLNMVLLDTIHRYIAAIEHVFPTSITQMVKNTTALIGCGLAICPKSSVDPNNDWPYYVCSKYLIEKRIKRLSSYLDYVTGYVKQLDFIFAFISIDKTTANQMIINRIHRLIIRNRLMNNYMV